MNRRASLPGADELFRPTAPVTPLRTEEETRREHEQRQESSTAGDEPAGRASGRRSHDAKITVYLTEEELLGLEQARLRLQAEFGIKVDRGRIVREAVADLLLDLHEAGPDARIVRSLG